MSQTITIIAEDNVIGVDGLFFQIENLSQCIPPNVRALQWANGEGEVEYFSGDNEVITSLEDYREAISHWKKAVRALEPTLESVAEQKRLYVNELCSLSITEGFHSSVLGEEHFYPFDREDQLNLMEAAASGTVSQIKCKDKEGVLDYRSHTGKELKSLLNDSKKHKQTQLRKALKLKQAISDAVLAEDMGKLQEISW